MDRHDGARRRRAACSGSTPGGSRDPGHDGAGSGGIGGGGGSGGTAIGDPVCGDGFIWFDVEECDDGNRVDTDCCDSRCQIVVPPCGNGTVECDEVCDDGNTEDGDACSRSCTQIGCWRDQECNADLGETCVRNPDPDPAEYGSCVVRGRWCDADADCGEVDREHCGAEGCYCRASAAAGDHAGVCWQRRYFLDLCDVDEECGASGDFTEPAACVPLACHAGGEERRCLPRDLPDRPCPYPYIEGRADDPRGNLAGFCVPQQGCASPEPCEVEGCAGPALPACDLVAGVCEPGCRVDAVSGATIGCDAARPACHVMSGWLGGGVRRDCTLAPAFGVGACGLPCDEDADCSFRGRDANRDPLVCRDRGGQRACAPRGCVDDAECPAGAGPYRGYCDPWTQACIYDRCRIGLDARPGCGNEVPFADCSTGLICAPEGSGLDTGTCVEPLP